MLVIDLLHIITSFLSHNFAIYSQLLMNWLEQIYSQLWKLWDIHGRNSDIHTQDSRTVIHLRHLIWHHHFYTQFIRKRCSKWNDAITLYTLIHEKFKDGKYNLILNMGQGNVSKSIMPLLHTLVKKNHNQQCKNHKYPYTDGFMWQGHNSTDNAVGGISITSIHQSECKKRQGWF